MWRHRHGPRADLNTGAFNRRVGHQCRDRAPYSVAAAEMPSGGPPGHGDRARRTRRTRPTSGPSPLSGHSALPQDGTIRQALTQVSQRIKQVTQERNGVLC
jgi:hypothetical protein